MYSIKVLDDTQTAEKIGEFLTSPNAFDQTWAPQEKAMVLKAPLDSIDREHHVYWYIEDQGMIIGAIGVRENKYGSGGYELDADFAAIHKDYRRQGLFTLLLNTLEQYVKEQNGRYIHILSCDIDSYLPARTFYEKNGYKKVAELPNYYVEGEGRVDYYKEL